MEENKEVKYCACNCGEVVTRKRTKFIYGHSKNLSAQEPPKCLCVCGLPTRFDQWSNSWNEFVNNHYLMPEEIKTKITVGKIKGNLERRNKMVEELPEPPDCACGCKEKVTLKTRGYPEWNEFVLGHSTKNKEIPEETKKKLSDIGKTRTGEQTNFYGKHHIPESKKKLSELAKLRVGPKSGGWKGGIHPIYKRIRTCERYTIWRLGTFERDHFTCQHCEDKKGGNLHAHHKKLFNSIIKEHNIFTIEQAVACKELWDLNNGIALCRKCHIKEHKRLNKLTQLAA